MSHIGKFEIFEVDRKMSEVTEGLGTKPKFWYRDAENNSWLFKVEERGTGEDWAEKIACELCKLIGLPHVHYELAKEVSSKTPGVICQSCAPPPTSLVLGNQLLFEKDSTYPRNEGTYKIKEHTVASVVDALRDLQMPPKEWLSNLPEGITSALEIYTGYLMLDAWIANQDRHHENWGALHVGEALHLAPTFDHGAGLARNITDKERAERLTTRDKDRQIPAYTKKARSAIYKNTSDNKPLHTHNAFGEFATLVSMVAKRWLVQLGKVDKSEISAILDKVPKSRMSEVAKTFTLELLLENQRRLLT